VAAVFYVPTNRLADLNDDNNVDISDVAAFCQDWLLSGQTLTNSTIGDSLLYRWSFDSQISGLGYTADGINNGAVVFDGFEDTIYHGSTLGSNLSNFTITFWVRPDRIPYRTAITYYMMNIVGNTNKNTGSIQLSIRDDSRLRLEVYSTDGGGLETAYNNIHLLTNKWYHVAVLYSKNPNQVKYYINGELDRIVTLSNQVACRIGPLYIGSYADDTRFLDGVLDELRIYNRQLTESEIAYLAAGAAGTGSIIQHISTPANFIDEQENQSIVNFFDYAEFSWDF
jgi:hypothetical protein